MHTEFWWEYLRERYQSEDLGVDGRIILKEFSSSGVGGIHWVVLAEDRNRWRAVGNAIMNLWDPYNEGNFLTSFSRRTLLCELDEKLDGCGRML